MEKNHTMRGGHHTGSQCLRDLDITGCRANSASQTSEMCAVIAGVFFKCRFGFSRSGDGPEGLPPNEVPQSALGVARPQKIIQVPKKDAQ